LVAHLRAHARSAARRSRGRHHSAVAQPRGHLRPNSRYAVSQVRSDEELDQPKVEAYVMSCSIARPRVPTYREAPGQL